MVDLLFREGGVFVGEKLGELFELLIGVDPQLRGGLPRLLLQRLRNPLALGDQSLGLKNPVNGVDAKGVKLDEERLEIEVVELEVRQGLSDLAIEVVEE